MNSLFSSICGLFALGVAAVTMSCSPSLKASTPALESRPGSPPANAYETFDIVWSRVEEKHFDPTHNGVDWEAIGDLYRPRVEETRSNAELRELLQEMLAELGQSHFVIIPAASNLEKGSGLGGDGTIGIRLGWVGGHPTVVGVHADSPAAEAGITPGWILESVDGNLPTEVFAHLIEAMESSDSPLIAGEAAIHLDQASTGVAGSSRTFIFKDTKGEKHERTLTFIQNEGTPVKFGNLPAMPTLIESRWLEQEELDRLNLSVSTSKSNEPRIGYIYFNIWMFPIMAPFADAIDTFRAADGLVLDLRRNTGGLGGLSMGVAGHLINEKVSLGTMAMRETTLEFVVNPQRATMDGRLVKPYAGPVAVIVDAGTASTSEVFGAGIQQLGRAHVFGRNSMGAALPAQTEKLPNGDVFMFAIANFTGPAGTSIEGTGVVPDHPITLTQSSLEAQWDPDLRAAVDWINSTINP